VKPEAVKNQKWGEPRETRVNGEIDVSIEIISIYISFPYFHLYTRSHLFLPLFVCLREGGVKGET
jgi:hypothetical protein